MKNYRVLFLSIMFLTCFSLFSETARDERLQQIEQEIHSVKEELHEEGLKAMKLEVTSENYMKYEWDKYTKEIEKAEVVDQKIYKLQAQLKALQAEKADLMKNTHL